MARTLYHVAPSRVRSAILTEGLRPDLSRGNAKVVWLVNAARLEWAIVHVRRRHQTGSVTVFRVRARQGTVRRSAVNGIYYSPVPIIAVAQVPQQ